MKTENIIPAIDTMVKIAKLKNRLPELYKAVDKAYKDHVEGKPIKNLIKKS